MRLDFEELQNLPTQQLFVTRIQLVKHQPKQLPEIIRTVLSLTQNLHLFRIRSPRLITIIQHHLKVILLPIFSHEIDDHFLLLLIRILNPHLNECGALFGLEIRKLEEVPLNEKLLELGDDEVD